MGSDHESRETSNKVKEGKIERGTTAFLIQESNATREAGEMKMEIATIEDGDENDIYRW